LAKMTLFYWSRAEVLVSLLRLDLLSLVTTVWLTGGKGGRVSGLNSN
jgi:hypothetical protein